MAEPAIMTTEPLTILDLPTLETERLVLRPFLPSDAPAMFEMNQLITKNASEFIVNKRPETLEETEARLSRIAELLRDPNTTLPWAVTLRGSDVMIGTTGFIRWNKPHFNSEIFYELHPMHWRKGIISESASRVVAFGFLELNLHRIEAHIDPANSRSIGVAEKIGFTREGVLRENTRLQDGTFGDTVVYAKLAP